MVVVFQLHIYSKLVIYNLIILAQQLQWDISCAISREGIQVASMHNTALTVGICPVV